jgi:hypothetical protein
MYFGTYHPTLSPKLQNSLLRTYNLAVEAIEDSFSLRNYGDVHGKLYKPDSLQMANFDFSGLATYTIDGGRTSGEFLLDLMSGRGYKDVDQNTRGDALGDIATVSIVRFRTVVKDPLDLVFLFWSITSGIIVGAGMIPLAVVSSLLMDIVITIFVNKKSRQNPYMLVVNCENSDIEDSVMKLIESNTGAAKVKVKIVSKTGMELTVEVLLKDGYSKFINDIINISGGTNAVMVSYNGQYMD